MRNLVLLLLIPTDSKIMWTVWITVRQALDLKFDLCAIKRLFCENSLVEHCAHLFVTGNSRSEPFNVVQLASFNPAEKPFTDFFVFNTGKLNCLGVRNRVLCERRKNIAELSQEISLANEARPRTEASRN